MGSMPFVQKKARFMDVRFGIAATRGRATKSRGHHAYDNQWTHALFFFQFCAFVCAVAVGPVVALRRKNFDIQPDLFLLGAAITSRKRRQSLTTTTNTDPKRAE
nr:hypothetical protein [Pandoravirus massiliensis]